MEKLSKSLKVAALEQDAERTVLELLRQVPFLQIDETFQRGRPNLSAQSADFEIGLRWPGGETLLLCEVKPSGQPSIARNALSQLEHLRIARPGTVGVFIAPYISSKVASMCDERGIGTVDLSGNARLTFGNVFIRYVGQPNRFSEARERRSMFAPKASRVLRVLLEQPRERWQVQALASEAEVSLGQVSTVKRMLAESEWLASGPGIQLARPEEALRQWAAHPGRAEAERVECFTSKPQDEALQTVSEALSAAGTRHALCGQSAAWRYAPMVRPNRVSVYVDGELSAAVEAATLKVVPSGGNVVLIRPRDAGVFYRTSVVNGVPVVGTVQAYLDCMRSGNRGEEAAQAILEQKLRSTW